MAAVELTGRIVYIDRKSDKKERKSLLPRLKSPVNRDFLKICYRSKAGLV